MVEQFLEANNGLQAQDNFNDASSDNELSFHHLVPSILDDLDWNDITEMIQNMDKQCESSSHARRQAKRDKKMMLSIRNKLSEENLIARLPYKGGQLYICSKEQFQQKASKYIDETGIYHFINVVNPTNPKVMQKCLKNVIKQVDTKLKTLRDIKFITDCQYVLMHPGRSTVRLNYLHFVPDLHKEGKPVQPIIICQNGPTWNMIRYLSDILWSMFTQVTGCQTFSNGDDIVYALEHYVRLGYLHETTRFVTFSINNICTKFSHEIGIKALGKFLNMYASELGTASKGLTNETIIQLVRLVLQNQFFIYENKLYQQIHGSASGSLLTIPLACIYLFYGQSPSFIQTFKTNKNELFGRCRDDIFFTWNDSKDELQRSLNEIVINEQQHPSIPPLMTAIGTTVHLLDLELGHDKGHLRTKIYRDPETDEYELPNKFQYHTSQPSLLLKAALRHTVQCCSNEEDFCNERRHLKLAHLMRGFSPEFIYKHIDEFYNELGIETGSYILFPTIPYQTLRQSVLDSYKRQMTMKQQQQRGRQNIISVPYPNHYPAQMAINMKNDILNIIKDSLNDKEALNDIEFELVPRPQTPLTINDYLVDKRPPLRLLTLPD